MPDMVDVASVFVAQLKAWGVDVVFGVPGDDLLPFLDALGKDGDVRFIGASHEAGAGFMASGWARLTGSLGVCVSSSAGALNLLEGIADARFDGLPVLAITGQVDLGKIGTGVKQAFDQQGVFGNFADSTELATDPDSSLRLLVRAMSGSMVSKTVNHLSVPRDLWSKEVHVSPIPFPDLVRNSSTVVTGSGVLGDIGGVARLISESLRPILLLGKEAGGAVGEIRRMAGACCVPVVVAQEAKGLVPDSWEAVVGGIGEGWMPGMVGDSDMILLIGSAPYEEGFLPDVPVVQVGTEFKRMKDTYLTNSLTGGIPGILDELARRSQGIAVSPEWRERARKARESLLKARTEDSRREGRPIHPGRVMADLSRMVAGDAIISLDTGAFMHWFDRGFEAVAQRILISSGWRSMGGGLPTAIAAQVACPGRQVVVLTGDGGLLMSMGELATVQAYGLPIKILVINNGSYGLEKDKARSQGLKPLGLSLPTVDFAGIGESFGIMGLRVGNSGELESALTEAFSLPEPVLVDILVDDIPLPELV